MARSQITGKRLATLMICIVVLLACLLAYVWLREGNDRSFKGQVHLLGISEHEMRDYTNVGCTFWHHEPKDVSYVDGCYLHTYTRYVNLNEEGVVMKRLKSNGWIQQNYRPNFFILPRGIHGLDTVFFKNSGGNTYCAGIENGGKAFNLHIFSDTDDNCRKMVGSSATL